MRRIVSLEGLPCAGKTTFFDRYYKSHQNFVCVPELYIQMKKDDEGLDILDKYAKAEISKKLSIGEKNKNLLTDRSIISTFAFSYAKQKFTGDSTEHDFNRDFVGKCRDEILIPTTAFVFDITPQISIKRREKVTRDDTLSLWCETGFLQHFSDYYRSDGLKSTFPNTEIYFVDTSRMDGSDIYDFISGKLG